MIYLLQKNGVGKKQMDNGNHCRQLLVKRLLLNLSQRLVKNLSSVAIPLKAVPHDVKVTKVDFLAPICAVM